MFVVHDVTVGGMMSYHSRDSLKKLGFRWNPSRSLWYKDGIFSKKAILESFKSEKIAFQILRSNVEGYSSKGDRCQVKFRYDQERHEYTTKENGCICTKKNTCKLCQTACCKNAIPCNGRYPVVCHDHSGKKQTSQLNSSPKKRKREVKKKKKKIRTESHVWCLTFTRFMDTYEEERVDWLDCDKELYWKKEDAEKRVKDYKLLKITEAVKVYGFVEYCNARMFLESINDFLREEMKKSWNNKRLKELDRENLWKQSIEQLEKLLLELPDDKFESIYCKVIEGPFLPALERIDLEKIEVA